MPSSAGDERFPSRPAIRIKSSKFPARLDGFIQQNKRFPVRGFRYRHLVHGKNEQGADDGQQRIATVLPPRFTFVLLLTAGAQRRALRTRPSRLSQPPGAEYASWRLPARMASCGIYRHVVARTYLVRRQGVEVDPRP